MRRTSFFSSLAVAAVFAGTVLLNPVQAAQPAEWTFLVFLNGNNSLDSFGTMNLKQMEKVGSTDKVNIVVQWASLKTRKVQRLLIKKNSGGSGVTSPVVETLKADMGDWHSVVDFVKWGAAHYPANHYFVDVWDHGSGWHSKTGVAGPKDISLDEITGHMITTRELGEAMTQSSSAIGKKIDVYGSDACLMAMAEIANEMEDSVSVFAGSEEVEPGDGWPYDAFLARLTAKPQASAIEVATMLSQEYQTYYKKKSSDVTFSAFDLSKMPALRAALLNFSNGLKSMPAATAKKVLAAARKSQNFTNSDYVDLIDFLKNLGSVSISAETATQAKSLNAATQDLIITSNNVGFDSATGLSIWLPQSSSTLQEYAQVYSQLKFDSQTHWTDFLSAMNK